MSDDDEAAFMASMQTLFDAHRFSEIIDAWGADTSRSEEFKAAAFASYSPSSDDVVVATYPKCGTTWTMQIAYQLGYLGDAALEHIDSVVTWPDKLIPLPENPDLGDRGYLADSPTGLKVIKSHLEAEFVPVDSDARFVSIIRDPKDALVSIFHFENGFNQLLFGGSVPLDVYVDTFMTDRFIYQQWPSFIDSWWKLRERENVLVMLYEDMRADGAAAVRTIADFLGIDLDDAQFDSIVEKSSFAWMKEHSHLFDPPAWEEGPVKLVREGQTGSADTGLRPDQRAAIDAWCKSELARLGSDFPYHRYERI